MTNMNNLLYEPEQIRNKVLALLATNGMVRIATISEHCFDENTMWKVLKAMQEQKQIIIDGAFICK